MGGASLRGMGKANQARLRATLLCINAMVVSAFLGCDGDQPGEITPVPLIVQRFEPSGLCQVEGGYLVADDELVGSVLFVSASSREDLESGAGNARVVKIVRKRSLSAGRTMNSRLFGFQDIEGLASSNEWVYILGSHNGDEKGRRPDREFLIKAKWDLKSFELKVDDTVALPVLDLVERLTKKDGSSLSLPLNLEGVAVHDGALYIGLRSPVEENRALLFKFDEARLFAPDSSAEAPSVEEVGLSGAGIRDLFWDSSRDSLLIVAGPSIDDRGTFAIWELKGDDLSSIKTFDGSLGEPHGALEGLCGLTEGPHLLAFDRGGEVPASLAVLDLKK